MKCYENQYNWVGLKFPVAINKIGKFEKNNPDIAVNVLFTGKKGIFTARRSEFNCNCKKQVNLLMVVDGENRHYTPIKNISRLLKSLNAKITREHITTASTVLMVFEQSQQEISIMSIVATRLM